MPAQSAAVETAEPEIKTVRVFDAPRDLVFDAWTKPEHLARWWGPRGFTITTESHDFRPGGAWRLVMHGPDGKDYPNQIVFEEIVRPERVVYAHRGGDGSAAMFRGIVTFEAEGDKTRLTLRLVFASAAERDAVVAKYNAAEGNKQTLARLGEYVGALASGKPMPLEISRTFDAPRRLVFEAWTKAEHVSRWFTPKPYTTARCDLDFKPGGVLRVIMRAPDGSEHPFDGTFGAIRAPEMLEFRGKVGEVDVETTVTFADHGEKTTVHVRQTYSKDSDAVRGAPIGWGLTLDQLGAHIATLTRAS